VSPIVGNVDFESMNTVCGDCDVLDCSMIDRCTLSTSELFVNSPGVTFAPDSFFGKAPEGRHEFATRTFIGRIKALNDNMLSKCES
jgi:hypothetical protein